MTSIPQDRKIRALIFVPFGRDATVACGLLREAQIEAVISADLVSFEAALNDDICFVVAADEAMGSSDLANVVAWIEAQPKWSDLPFIILTRHGGGPERNPAAARLSELFGNVSFLERPFHPTTFVSVARTALRGRQRQYDARSRIEELHEGEERLRTALLAGHLGSWELDLATETLVCSDTCKAVFGRAPHQTFSYDDLRESVHPDDRARMRDAVAQTIATGCDYIIEYRNVWPDGSIHWAEVRARLVRAKAGRATRMVGVSSDITARKEAEADLRRLNETLEERVASRTTDLERAHGTVLAEVAQREQAEDQLRQSQKMEAVGQLTGGLAHDFNNLLTGITGSLDLLATRLAQGRAADCGRYIEAAQGAASRAAALTHRLLAFSRRQTLDPKPTDANRLIVDMADLVRRTVGPSIDLHVATEDNLWTTLVDPNQLENAVLNLCINARDAMPDGGRVTIETANRQVDATLASERDIVPGQYISLRVTDTGSGMAPEVIRRAFDPFFTTKPMGQGTGLGLSMIYGFARQSGGTVRIVSAIGNGTTISVYLPRFEGEAAAAEHIGPRVAPPTGDGETVLVVDDEPTVRMLIGEVLQDLGYKAIERIDGASGLKELQTNPRIDLLITDVGLPGGMNGRQLADAARTLRPDLKVLFITGYAETAVVSKGGLDAGMRVTTKPFAMDSLASQIREMISEADPAVTAPGASTAADDVTRRVR